MSVSGLYLFMLLPLPVKILLLVGGVPFFWVNAIDVEAADEARAVEKEPIERVAPDEEE